MGLFCAELLVPGGSKTEPGGSKTERETPDRCSHAPPGHGPARQFAAIAGYQSITSVLLYIGLFSCRTLCLLGTLICAMRARLNQRDDSALVLVALRFVGLETARLGLS